MRSSAAIPSGRITKEVVSKKRKTMAEREGFEPPIELPLCRISSAVLSTTQPPLHKRRTLFDKQISERVSG